MIADRLSTYLIQLFLIQILLRYSIGIQLQWFHVTHPIFTIFMYRSMAVAIVLDLSLPNELWNTMETLLSQVKKGFDICREVELTSVRERLKLHKYYLFSDMQPIIPMPYTSAGLISVPLTNLTHLCDQYVSFVRSSLLLSYLQVLNQILKSNRYTFLYKVFTLFC